MAYNFDAVTGRWLCTDWINPKITVSDKGISCKSSFTSVIDNYNAALNKTIADAFISKMMVQSLEEKKEKKSKKQIDDENKASNDFYRSMIKQVYFNKKKQATTVRWKDDSFTTVKLSPGDTFDPYYGITLCIAKKYFGNRPVVNEIIAKWGDTYYEDESKEDLPKAKNQPTRKKK